jgi:hypothetical protein
MEKPEKTDIKVKLSTLWVVVMVNMIYADIFSIIVTPHYIIVAAVEVTLLIIIIVNSWNWTIPESESYQEG